MGVGHPHTLLAIYPCSWLLGLLAFSHEPRARIRIMYYILSMRGPATWPIPYPCLTVDKYDIEGLGFYGWSWWIYAYMNLKCTIRA